MTTYTYTADDLQALGRLVRKKSDRRVLSPEDFEDLVQDILLAALSTKAPLGTPLVALAVQTARWTRYYTDANGRAMTRDANTPFGVSRSDGKGNKFDIETSDDRLADTIWRSKIDFVNELTIRDLIARLPQGQRDAFTYCAEGSATHQEAAEKLGVSAETVRRNLAKARETLQAQILAL